jgi:hypothetical protein
LPFSIVLKIFSSFKTVNVFQAPTLQQAAGYWLLATGNRQRTTSLKLEA